MKHLSILILLFAFIGPTTAQISTYDISTFQEPNRRQQRGGIELNSRFNNTQSKSLFNTDVRKENSFNANIGLYDSRFVDENNIESEMFSSLNLNANAGSDKLDSTSYFNNDISLSNFSQKRWYNESLKFFGLGLEFSGRHTTNRNRFFDENLDYNTRSNIIGLSVPTSIGIGQPQNANDAWHAITILEFLDAQGLLSKSSFTDDEIIGFANALAIIRNYRNTDPRLERISEVEQLVDYLTSNGMVNSSEYRFFAHLDDAWSFENFEERNSGTRFSIGLEPSIIINQFVDRFESNETRTPLGLDVFTAYDYYKPLSLDWQFDFESKLSFGPRQTIYGGDLEIEVDPYLRTELAIQLGIGHFMSRRTRWEVDFIPSVVNINYQSELQPFSQNTTIFNAVLAAQYQYYFSPQLSVFVSGSFNFNRQSSEFNPFYSANRLSFSSFYRFY